MSLVHGEDSESDEEINTEQLQSLVLTPDGSIRDYQGLIKNQKTAGIVMGEESETDEEEEGNEGSSYQPDAGQEQVKAPLQSIQTNFASTQESPRAESLEPITTAPQSFSAVVVEFLVNILLLAILILKRLLHKKLRERNQSLRKNIVDRILKLYSITCRNLTLVNNNLSKAQGTIETVNSNLKRSEHELSDLNSILRDINLEARGLAPYLSSEHVAASKKTPPSPLRHRLFKGISSLSAVAATATSKKMSPTPSEAQVAGPKVQPEISDARPLAQNTGDV